MQDIELNILAYTALLQVALLGLRSLMVNLQLGLKVTGGNRDKPLNLTGQAARVDRAMGNHFEALILFTIAVVVVVLAKETSDVTHLAAWIFLTARILYVPAYMSGIPLLRSGIWGVGFVATVIILVSALIAG